MVLDIPGPAFSNILILSISLFLEKSKNKNVSEYGPLFEDSNNFKVN